MTEKKTEQVKTNSYVRMVAKEMQVPYDDAYHMMKDIKEKYQISFSDFARNKLFLYRDEQLEQEAEKVSAFISKRNDHAIAMIAKATGWTKEEAAAETARIKEKFQI